MIPLNNSLSNTFYNKDSQEDLHAILAYVDLNIIYSEQQFHDILMQCIHKNPILNKCFVYINGNLYLEDDVSLTISDNYCIKQLPSEHFDNEIRYMLNKPLTMRKKWYCLYCFDMKQNKSCVFFKINHAYTDGYKLIKILSSIFACNEENITNQFKRVAPKIYNQLYYIIFGSILLLINTSFFLCKLFTSYVFKYSINKNILSTETDYLLCRKFDFNAIKLFTKRENITVNDFLYALMTRTSYLYGNKSQRIYTGIPINVSKMSFNNNFIPITLNIKNDLYPKTLLKQVHEMFNCCKYSLFIPTMNYINNISNYLSTNICSRAHNFIFENIDYNYTNIIGPKSDNFPDIANIRFLTTTFKEEVCFNIISFDNAINIICTFKKNVIQDKKHLENCIYEAYNNLLETTF